MCVREERLCRGGGGIAIVLQRISRKLYTSKVIGREPEAQGPISKVQPEARRSLRCVALPPGQKKEVKSGK